MKHHKIQSNIALNYLTTQNNYTSPADSGFWLGRLAPTQMFYRKLILIGPVIGRNIVRQRRIIRRCRVNAISRQRHDDVTVRMVDIIVRRDRQRSRPRPGRTGSEPDHNIAARTCRDVE